MFLSGFVKNQITQWPPPPQFWASNGKLPPLVRKTRYFLVPRTSVSPEEQLLKRGLDQHFCAVRPTPPPSDVMSPWSLQHGRISVLLRYEVKAYWGLSVTIPFFQCTMSGGVCAPTGLCVLGGGVSSATRDANNKQRRAMNLDIPWTETAQNCGLTFMVTWSIPLPALELVLGEKLPEVCLEPSSSPFSLCPQPTGDSEEARDGSSCRFRPKTGRHTYTHPKW